MLARKSACYYGADGFLLEVKMQQHMAERKGAPKFFGYHTDSRIAISEFITDQGIPHINDLKRSLPALIAIMRSIHDTPPEPFFISRNLTNDLATLLESLPASILRPLDARMFQKVLEKPWPQCRRALTHHDFHPFNILFDGTHYTVVDWDMAGLGHPFYDIAVLCNYLFIEPSLHHDILSLYLNAPPSDHDLNVLMHLRAFSYAFLAAINFVNAPSGSSSPLKINKANVFSHWRDAVTHEHRHVHYEIGRFFIEQMKRFADDC